MLMCCKGEGYGRRAQGARQGGLQAQGAGSRATRIFPPSITPRFCSLFSQSPLLIPLAPDHCPSLPFPLLTTDFSPFPTPFHRL